ncbi:MAG TPA: ABC transporter permease [Anaerolineae bacterium]|nr:ABC transporter permease [Anaerolineae bacterium]HOQ98342.1 ABC transporter permease [Anaerolineae bacterium]HPL26575.1 ABC transporter permease [Anaerolineae bacterium]
MWKLIIAEQSKVLRWKMLWIGVGLVSALVVLALAAMNASNPPQDILERQVIWPMVLVVVLRQFAANCTLTGLLLVAMVGGVVAQEYGWRTLHLVLGRGVGRLTLLGAKMGAMLVPTALVVGVPFLAGGAFSGWLTYQHTGLLPFARVHWLQLLWSVALAIYGLLPYVALALLCAVAGRSPVTAICTGVGIVLAENALWPLLRGLGSMGLQIARWFPMGLSMSMLHASEGIPAIPLSGAAAVDVWANLQLLEPGVAALATAAYLVVFLGVAGVVFVRQDLSG